MKGRTQRRIVAAALVACAVTTSAFAGAPSGSRCAGGRFVTAVGWACPGPGGLWRVTLDDGFTFLTHGPDPLDSHGDEDTFYRYYEVKPRDPSCVSSPTSEFHIQVLYSHPAGSKDNFQKRQALIKRTVERMNGLLYAEGAEFGRPLRFRMRCLRGSLSIANATLDVQPGAGFGDIVTAMRSAGYTSPLIKYWLYFEDVAPPGAGGTAQAFLDTTPNADNEANFGPNYGVFWSHQGNAEGKKHQVAEDYLANAMMHEGAHNLGAVNNMAPNSTLGGHCTDDSDVMCYADGGPNAPRYAYGRCTTLHFDCKHDDYFNPKPKPSNYLATHWNLASPLNRFVGGCHYKAGALTAGTGPVDVDDAGLADQRISSARVSIPTRCRGRAFGASAALQPLPALGSALGRIPATELAFQAGTGHAGPEAVLTSLLDPDVDVCFLKRNRLLGCSQDGPSETGTVPKAATTALIRQITGLNTIYTFSII